MKIAILGFARDGQAAYHHWNTPDNQITICDQDTKIKLPSGASSQLGTDYLKNLGQFDLLVRSAGLPPHLIAEANPKSPDILSKVTGNIDEFFACSPSQNIIGVTGTKGKGTTSTLIAKMLEAAGKTVHLGGNIGIPALELLKNNIQPNDWIILEQSSFQLIDQKHSPHIAVCLMVAPEHLNWHADMAEYMLAKQQLFAHQTASDITIYNRLNELSVKIAQVSLAKQQLSYEVPAMGQPPSATTGAYVKESSIYMNQTAICKIDDVRLLGRHNLENVCAAIAAVWDLINRSSDVVKTVLNNFAGLPHHLELVKVVDGVGFYDDSFGTTPETAIVALQTFTEPKVIILGGSDKQATFDQLAQAVQQNNVRSVITIGDTAPKIEAALRAIGYNQIFKGGTNIKDVVSAAQSQALPGDVVLLSTACASFGLFDNYKDRGQQFQLAVKAL